MEKGVLCTLQPHFGNTVDDTSAMIPGHQQRMVTVDQWVIPFQCRQGLIRMPMHPPTDEELDTLPTVVLSSDVLWEPGVLDHEINVEEDVYHEAMESPEELEEFNSFDPRYNETGHYLHVDCVARVLEAYQARTHPGQPMDTDDELNATVNPRIRRLNSYDCEKLRPYLLWLPLDRVKKTLENPTQWFRNMYRIPFRKHFKSRFPAFNVPRRHEPVATDTMWSEVPAIDRGAKGAQVFVGRTTKFVDVYPVRTDGEYVQTLEDNICRRGAMDMLMPRHNSVTRSRISYVCTRSPTIRASHTTSTKILLNARLDSSRTRAIGFSPLLVPLPICGFCVYPMSRPSSTYVRSNPLITYPPTRS